MIDLKEKKAVIFDLDGLLIDSEPIWDKVHGEFLRTHGLPHDKAVEDQSLGMGVRDFMGILKKKYPSLSESVETLAKEYRELFYRFALGDSALSLMPGEKHLLHCLKENTYILAIATGGHTEEKINDILTLLQIQDYFPTHISSDMVEKGKPDPAVYLKTAEVLKLKPYECIVLEDSVNGTKAGKAAGMMVIGVNSDQSYQKKLIEAGAEIIADRLDDLIPFFAGQCCGECECK